MRVADLEARVAEVERRLAALEGTVAETPSPEAPEETGTPKGDGMAAAVSTYIGRVLLIFGGAYLLRAITDFGFVPVAIGLLLGAAYGIFWLYHGYRKAAIGNDRIAAGLYTGTSVLLTFPLIHEATTHFQLIPGGMGVVALAVFWGLTIAVAGLCNLRSLAWLSTFAAIFSAAAALIASQVAVEVAVFLVLVGIATLWIVRWRDWAGLAWLGAIGANLGVLALVSLAQTGKWPIEPRLAFVIAVFSLAMYLLSFTYHTHVRRVLVGFFETFQALVGGLIVLGAAVLAVRAGQLELALAGYLGLTVGIGGYALALARETRIQRYRNFFYYSYIGLVFVVVGTALVLPVVWATLVWVLMAMIMARASRVTGWVSLSLQTTLLLVVAGAASGALAKGLQALAGSPDAAWAIIDPMHIVVIAATVACLFIPVAQHSERWGSLAQLPQLIALMLVVWEVGGLVVANAAVLLAGASEATPNLALLAALRTAVLSVAAVTLAASSRHSRWPEARWLVYPVLILVGIKLFVEDFPNGDPASLFLALAFIGSALLLVARLLRQSESSD